MGLLGRNPPAAQGDRSVGRAERHGVVREAVFARIFRDREPIARRAEEEWRDRDQDRQERHDRDAESEEPPHGGRCRTFAPCRPAITREVGEAHATRLPLRVRRSLPRYGAHCVHATQICSGPHPVCGSSQTSPASMTPLPHTGGWHVHVARQWPGHAASLGGGVPPGPPGSHCSLGALKPSPQTAGEHVHSAGSPGGRQVCPGPHCAWPLPSHCSPTSTTLLPHAVLQVQFGRHWPGQAVASLPSHCSCGRFFTPSPQYFASTLFGKRIAPGPGRPAVLLTAGLVVAGMQNVDASTSVLVPGVPVRTIGSRKQRRVEVTQVPSPTQFASLVQETWGAPEHDWSNGPATHSASPVAWTPWPGRVCPAMERQSGTQTPDVFPAQSALVVHGCASWSPPLHALRHAFGCVSPEHQHCWFVKPEPVQA